VTTRRDKEKEQMALQIMVLEESFDLVAPRGEELVERFYEQLFTNAPEVRPFFAGTDVMRRRRMLLGALALLQQSLRDLASVVPTLQALGVHLAAQGVRPEHYPIFGAALLVSLADVGGNEWRHRYTRAWADAYVLVQKMMLSGATNVGPAKEKPRAVPSAA
jgi:hemoglobin-like flavoprotein